MDGGGLAGLGIFAVVATTLRTGCTGVWSPDYGKSDGGNGWLKRWWWVAVVAMAKVSKFQDFWFFFFYKQ